MRCFSFLQLAQGQDGSFRRFAVLEFATAEMAEEAQRLTDGRLLGGTHIRVSFCAPGPPGRSMLAALIAAQTMVSKKCFLMSKAEFEFFLTLVLIACLVALSFKAVNRGKGLLPDPTALQILTGLSNPTTLKMLLNPLSQGHKQGEEFLLAVDGNQLFFLESVLLQCLMLHPYVFLFAGLLGAAPTMPLLANPALSAALLQLLIQNQAKAQQVLLPLCLFSHMFLLASKSVLNDFALLIHTTLPAL